MLDTGRLELELSGVPPAAPTPVSTTDVADGEWTADVEWGAGDATGDAPDPDLQASMQLAQQLEAEEATRVAREAQELEDEAALSEREELSLVAEVRAFERREAAREQAMPGLSAQKRALLPLMPWPAERLASADDLCIFCQHSFAAGEEVVTLPCFHHFHSECLDPWLKIHKKCPTCQIEIKLSGS